MVKSKTRPIIDNEPEAKSIMQSNVGDLTTKKQSHFNWHGGGPPALPNTLLPSQKQSLSLCFIYITESYPSP